VQTIRKKLSVLFLLCSVFTIIIITLFVNRTISNKFDEYVVEIQNKRHQDIVTHFSDVYSNEGTWTSISGTELIHEAYMGNYCLTLWDKDKNYIWGMNPEELDDRSHLKSMVVQDQGVFSTKTFEIKSEGVIVGYVDIGQYSSVLLTKEDINFKSSIIRSIIFSGMITLCISVGLSLVFSKHFSAPIKDVANMSVKLSRGDFDIKSIAQSNIVELEELRKSVNVLAEKLNHQDDLRKRLITDITHEVRTPLNVLQNNLEAMIDGVFPVTTERLNNLNEEVIRFGRLLNNLNSLKEFESEHIKQNVEIIFLDELLIDISKDFYTVAQAKNIQFNFQLIPDQQFTISGDKDKIKQLFINLLSNAFKFTKENGMVDVALYTDRENIIVEVKDSGIGIAKEHLPFIFERLYRTQESSGQVEGNGIGLTIVKNIVQIHGATIEVESEEGIGSVFTIVFKKNNHFFLH